jgi:glutathione peroxidase-family protein
MRVAVVVLAALLLAARGKVVLVWNFTKYLRDRRGSLVARYDSGTRPEAIEAQLERLL